MRESCPSHSEPWEARRPESGMQRHGRDNRDRDTIRGHPRNQSTHTEEGQMGWSRTARRLRSTRGRRLAILTASLAAMTACGSSTTSVTTTPSPSPTASIPVTLIPTSADVCAAVPTPGCTELGDPFGAPKSCQVTLNEQFSIPRSPEDKLHSYGAGAGPVYLSGQLFWYVGGQEAVFLIDVAYAGAVRITGQLAGDATAVPTFTGADVSD